MSQKIKILVWLWTEFGNPWKLYTGLSEVLHCHQKYFIIKTSDEVIYTILIDRLKPALFSENKTARDFAGSQPQLNSLSNSEGLNRDKNTIAKSNFGRMIKWEKEKTFILLKIMHKK